jgi:hypothetical protein
MQDKSKQALRELQEDKQVRSDKPGILSVKPSTESKTNRVHYPDFWKKKRLNPEFVKQLQETANREPSITDDFGQYKEGIFLHGCTIVIVAITDGLWGLEIKSEHPVPLHVIKEIRYKYLPDECLMAQLLPSRKERGNDSNVMLYQIPGSLTDNKEDEQ